MNMRKESENSHTESGQMPWELCCVTPDPAEFLENGDTEDVEAYVETVLGYVAENLEHRMFRDYLILDVWYSCLRFLMKRGMDASSFSEVVAPWNPRHVAKGEDGVKEYMVGLLRKVLYYYESDRDNGSRKGLKKALDYIDSHYMLEDLSLNMVADAMNFSPNYFSALFSQEMNMTFIEYVAGKRMEKAETLLKETTLRSSEIAPRIGYRDPHYFAYVFKRFHGCTPREYRNHENEEKP